MTVTTEEKPDASESTGLLDSNDDTNKDNNDDQHEEHHHHRHPTHHRDLSAVVPLYSRPVQLQRWGETQLLPHVNWGDLFFDLFIVAAAYNLDAIMEHEPSYLGLLGFVCCLLPICLLWSLKLAYDARFSSDDNLYHRGQEIVFFAISATIIQHIQPVNIMTDTAGHHDMTLFAGSLTASAVFGLVQSGEIKEHAEGGEEAKHQAQSDKHLYFIAFSLYLAATIIAAHDYAFVTATPGYQNLLPLILCGLVYPVMHAYSAILSLFIIPNHEKEFTELRVPLNLEYTLHRLAEFVMLMLGESILSLLIAPQSKGWPYYVTFYCGIVTVTVSVAEMKFVFGLIDKAPSDLVSCPQPFLISRLSDFNSSFLLFSQMLQYLYFRSQPFNIADHALRRSSVGGMLYSEFLTIFAGCLIVFGGSFKLTLDQYILEETMSPETVVGLYTIEERRHRIANLACWSLTIAIMALNVMVFLHRGFADNFRRFIGPNGCLAPAPTLIITIDMGLIIVTGLLSQWTQNLELLSCLILLITLCHVLLRTFGLKYFPVSKAAMDLALGRTPSVP